ncbi:hypothetical protein CC2G_012394 [Coprinopsis cinerea AmutBmut pab1-1]|nr:hypothetical protein CC2G_012394 [Coprinopsis cinerea AmutBmut pab1-1]
MNLSRGKRGKTTLHTKPREEMAIPLAPQDSEHATYHGDSYFASNLARPRFIPKQRTNGVKVHRSVKLRMETEYEEEKKRLKGKKYQPKAVLRVEPTWVD